MKTTRGKWLVQQLKGFPRMDNLPKVTVDCSLIAQIGGGELEEVENNAILIADAGNTIQTCNLLPSELLKQRDSMFLGIIHAYLSLQIDAYKKVHFAPFTDHVRASLRNQISEITGWECQAVQEYIERIARDIVMKELTYDEGVKKLLFKVKCQ